LCVACICTVENLIIEGFDSVHPV